MHRALRPATVIVCAVVLAVSSPPATRTASAEPASEGAATTVKARLTGWVSRRDGYHLFREGAAVRMVVRVRPPLPREEVLARLEWRRSGTRWRLLDVSTSRFDRDGRAAFRVGALPDGYSFRIRAKVPPTGDHRAGRSAWRYFRVR